MRESEREREREGEKTILYYTDWPNFAPTQVVRAANEKKAASLSVPLFLSPRFGLDEENAEF